MLFHTIVLCPGLRILKKLKKNLQVPYGAVKTFFVREPCRALNQLLWNAWQNGSLTYPASLTFGKIQEPKKHPNAMSESSLF
jgi:hypothetical protein